MLYFSEEAHYSILKIARILNMPHTTVKRQPDGEIDYDDLRDMLTVHRDRPAIILATIGTTMRGAVDDIPAIRQIIDELGIGEHYIHADAALSGMILPYVDDPQPFGFDAGINSISISGHKLIGAPLPFAVLSCTGADGEQRNRLLRDGVGRAVPIRPVRVARPGMLAEECLQTVQIGFANRFDDFPNAGPQLQMTLEVAPADAIAARHHALCLARCKLTVADRLALRFGDLVDRGGVARGEGRQELLGFVVELVVGQICRALALHEDASAPYSFSNALTASVDAQSSAWLPR